MTSFANKIQTIEGFHENSQNIFTVKLLVGESIHLFIGRNIHVLTYVLLTIIHFARNKSNLNAVLSPFNVTILVKWIRLLSYSVAIAHSCNLINTLYLFLSKETKLNGYLPLSFVAAFAIANLSLQVFINPYILYGFNNIKYYSTDSILAKKYKTNVKSNETFTESWLNELLEKIKSIEKTKKFTEKGYNLSKMALDLDSPKYQLNHYFKEISKESFSEWKNRNRITFAKELIDQGYLNTFKVDTLSQECGYKSRGNFNSAFEEVTKIKLSEYVKIG
jgi:AraC-like DNA-binding protein